MRTPRASDGGTALHCAAEFNHPRAVRALLDFRRPDGQPVVDATMTKGSPEIYGLTALHLGVANGAVDIVRDLIDFEPGLVDVQASNGFTPLHVAAQNGHAHVAALLIFDRK